MKVECQIEYGETENDNGRTVECVTATCSECDHSTEAYGTSGASVRRCLVLMREECPRGEANYYVAAEGEDER